MKKFELTTEFITNSSGTRLFKIRALVSFGDVVAGDFGGYIESEDNISHSGNAWVYGNTQVYSDAIVSGNAQVRGNTQLYGDTWISSDAWVCGNADYVHIHGFETKNRTTTFYRNKDGGVSVRSGCFVGTINDFREKVKRTHVHSKYEKEYLTMAHLMQMHFEN